MTKIKYYNRATLMSQDVEELVDYALDLQMELKYKLLDIQSLQLELKYKQLENRKQRGD